MSNVSAEQAAFRSATIGEKLEILAGKFENQSGQHFTPDGSSPLSVAAWAVHLSGDYSPNNQYWVNGKYGPVRIIDAACRAIGWKSKGGPYGRDIKGDFVQIFDPNVDVTPEEVLSIAKNFLD